MAKGKHAASAAKKRADRAEIHLAALRHENGELRRANARLEVIPTLEARILALESALRAARGELRKMNVAEAAGLGAAPKPSQMVSCRFCERVAARTWFTPIGLCEAHLKASVLAGGSTGDRGYEP